MPRVASLYLPNLATDRLRLIDRGARPDLSSSSTGSSSREGEWWPAARLPENSKERAKLIALRERLEQEKKAPLPEPGTRIEDCSCPRDGHWRPGARWSRREEVQARIEAMPPHQRPPIRELGRRSEAADMPFKRNRGKQERPSTSLGTNETLLPLVTIHRSGNRMEIAAACPDARALGLRPGMPATQARAMVPGLDIRHSEHEAEAAILTRLALFAARRWTPTAAVSGPDGLWLDLSGVAHLFGGERAMCALILRFCARTGFAARIAVADTAGAAHALARQGAAPITLCPAGGEAEAIAPLPIDSLRIEPAIAAAARRLGIDRVGDLLAMPRGPLVRRFGQGLVTRLDQALGRAPEPFDPVVPADPPCASARFAEPIASAEAIEQAVRDLMAALMRTLEGSGLAVRRLALRCLRVDGQEQSIGIGTARATRDAPHLLRLLCAKIEKIEPGFGIEAMRLVAARAEPLRPQPIESELGGGKPAPDLVPLIDRIAGRIGARRLFRTSAVESDVPERSLRYSPPLAATDGWPPDLPRPVRVLAHPEPVDKVMAELPDQPPLRFSWRGRMHRVARADGPERIYGEWWKRSGEADAVRDYFQIEDEEGARFWLYRRGDGLDGRTGDLSWWLQGMFG